MIGKGVLLLLLFVYTGTFAQVDDTAPAPLFREEKPLRIKFTISFETLKKSRKDSVYFPTVMSFENEAGVWDTVHATVRARGNFRRKNCFVPPMRIKIAKEDRKDNIFHGVKTLKLVLPCNLTNASADLLLKEYICYQLYEPLTPYVFGTRLVDVTLIETSGKNIKTHELKGFFIEDDDAAAKRYEAKVVDLENLHPMLLQDTCSLRHDFFQYMIGNTDYSTTFFHNAKVIKTKAGHYIPIAYDFDMSGFVNAPYATFDESLGIKDVRQRLFRGFCRNDQVAQFVRAEYILAEPRIYAVIDKHRSLIATKEYTNVMHYLGDFFEIIKSDGAFKQNIILSCRTR